LVAGRDGRRFLRQLVVVAEPVDVVDDAAFRREVVSPDDLVVAVDLDRPEVPGVRDQRVPAGSRSASRGHWSRSSASGALEAPALGHRVGVVLDEPVVLAVGDDDGVVLHRHERPARIPVARLAVLRPVGGRGDTAEYDDRTAQEDAQYCNPLASHCHGAKDGAT
jgi:hypothetical protein